MKFFSKSLTKRLPFSGGTIKFSPPLTLALLYFSLIVAGGIILKLPFMTDRPIGWSDALFTSASAVTVTGLTVVDTGTTFSFWGQLVLVMLMQLGGLGLMTFAMLVLAAVGVPMPVSQQVYLKEDLRQTSIRGITRLSFVILRVVLICELIGAAALAFVFVPDYGWGEGIWAAIFHAISAFNNAGFSLFPDSMSRWEDNPIVNIFIPGLIIVGGIGYAVIADLSQNRRWRGLTLHSKIMLTGTAGLLVFSTLATALLEWNNPATIGSLGTSGEKMWASWFQAVMTRTAGFNTIDITALRDATSFLYMILMLIGGGPTSTAGGLKVTTFIILMLATFAFFRQKRTIDAFGRSISMDQILKVLAVTVMLLSILVTALFLLLVTQDEDFVRLAFEATSAMATTGLSLGATPDLDNTGRFIICAVMFLGRVGPLTLGFFLATRTPPRVQYPPGRIFIG